MEGKKEGGKERRNGRRRKEGEVRKGEGGRREEGWGRKEKKKGKERKDVEESIWSCNTYILIVWLLGYYFILVQKNKISKNIKSNVKEFYS
jgi:hypothetical protein